MRVPIATVSEVTKRFRKAADETSSVLSVADGRDLVEIYALWKQSSVGDNHTRMFQANHCKATDVKKNSPTSHCVGSSTAVKRRR